MSQSPPQQKRQWYEFEGESQADLGLSADDSAIVAPAGIQGRGPRAGAAAAPPTTDPEEGHHAPIGLPRSLGVPPAGSRYRRSRVSTPFDLRSLPSIERGSVEMWDLVQKHVPSYLRSGALLEVVRGFLTGLLGEPDAKSRGVTLEVKRLEDQSQSSHDVVDDEITIGTHATSKIQLSGAAISRRHVRLVFDDGAFQLVDQGSSNGTFLRGERLQAGYAYPLRNHETFTIPGHELTLRWEESPPAPKLKDVTIGALRLEDGRALLSSVPKHGALAEVRVEPGGAIALIELDLPLCSLIVEQVLGTAGVARRAVAGGAGATSPLGQVERGVCELCLVKLLDEIQQRWGSQAECTLSLVRLHDVVGPELKERAEKQRWLTVSLGIDFDQRRDPVRVCIPRPAVETLGERFARTVDKAGATIEELFLRYRDHIGFARVELACRVGEMKVSRAELASLEIGAICFPDAMSLALAGEGVGGSVELVPTYGGGGKIACVLTEFAGPVRFEVQEVTTGAGSPEPDGGGMQEQQGEPEFGEGAAMLESVPMAVVIELGRLSLTVRDLAGLRRGQVLELARTADDPVNLVVDGHLVGSGKLVNVEGEIGVQVLELLR